MTLGKGKDKTVLPLFPTQYQGEIQDEGTEFTIDGNETESDDNPIEFIHNVGKHQRSYSAIGIGEYFTPMRDDDSDNAILSWHNLCLVNNVTMVVETQPRNLPPSTSNLKKRSAPSKEIKNNPPLMEEEWEDAMFSSNALIKSYVSKDVYKEMNLGTEEVPKIIKVHEKLSKTEWQYWYNFFKRNIKVFAYTYKNLRGVPLEVCEHKIILEEGTAPVSQRQYRMNPKYSLMVKEDIDKLLEAGFIYKVPYSEWVSPIVVIPKKNGKLRICQDFRKLNNVTRKDYFPLPFTDTMLDAVVRYKLYSFMDGFLGYNQIQIFKPHRWYTTFTTDWGTFAYIVMPLGLYNAPTTFQRVMTEAFHKYLRKFREIVLDDFVLFGSEENYVDYLQKYFDKCMEFFISINVAKSVFLVPFGRLVGHIVSEQGIATDPDKIANIVSLPIPTTVTEVKGFLGHTGYYRRFIFCYVVIIMPLTKLF